MQELYIYAQHPAVFSHFNSVMNHIVFRLALAITLGVIQVAGDLHPEIPFPANCSTRALCSGLRTRIPDWDEVYNAEFSGEQDGALLFTLTNEKNTLTMTLGGVVNNRFRINIEEPDLHRHHIEHSLEKEPTTQRLAVESESDDLLTASDEEGNRVVVTYKPLKLEFYHDGVLETVLEGNRLIMENTEDSQAFTFLIRFAGAKRLMGIPEHPTSVNLLHTADYQMDPYRLKNVDYIFAGYPLNVTEAMYGSIPVLYGFGEQTSGIFMHNGAEMWIDIDNEEKSAYFMVESGVLDAFILLGPTLRDTVRQYTDLTGKPHLPQLWALGYHQSRWAYNSTPDVQDIIGKFDEYDFPLDVLWLDIEYTSERKWFTWNATSFPDPVELLDWVDAQGHRKLVPISDCHIKVDPTYKIYTDCLENDLFVKNADGTPFVSICWPGDASWVDFLNPAARDYYANLHLYENFPSTSALGGYWNDMNEPSIFDNMYERTFPYDALHYGNVSNRDIHNMYGLLNVMSTHQGLMARDESKLRPFILSRSVFAGSQRYTANWNGDTDSTFDFLRILLPMTIASNLGGLVFYGGDVPGFFGKPSDEIASRWYQTGAWIPFYRAHGDLSTERREPWTFSETMQPILREAIQTRYKHLPYWYTLFYEHTVTGDPLVRPLFYHYPDDENVLDIFDEFLVGENVLVANVGYAEISTLEVYLPGRGVNWYLFTGTAQKVYAGGEWHSIEVDLTFTPVFYRSGSVIVRKPRVKRSTADIKDDPYELHILPDENGLASTTIYVDDFESFEYLNEKRYLYINFEFDLNTRTGISSSIDSDTVSEGFSIEVESSIIYVNNGDGFYTTETVSHEELDLAKVGEVIYF